MSTSLQPSTEIDFSELPEGRRRLRFTALQIIGGAAILLLLMPFVAYLVDYELFIGVLVFEALGLYLLIPSLGILLLFSSDLTPTSRFKALTSRGKHENALIQAFAQKNYLSQGERLIPDPKSEPGSLFRFGTNHQCDNAIGGDFMGLEYVLYRHEYYFGSKDAYNWRFENTVMAFTLPRVLPQFIIDSRLYSKGNIQSGLPLLFDRSQEIELEGSFSQYFRLYAPVQYEVPALAILTPDVMLAIMESGMECDIEIVGDRLYFYWPYAEPTAENYQAYYNVAEVFLKEVKRKLLVSDIYTTEEQALRHSTSDSSSGIRLKPGLFAIINNKYAHFPQAIFWGVAILLFLASASGISSSSDLIRQISIFILWIFMVSLGLLMIVAYTVAFRNALIQSRGVRLARKLRRSR